MPPTRDVVLLHGLEQRGLGLGRRAVDLVGQEHVGEERAAARTGTRARRSPVLLEDVRAGDVGGHQVGRELDALEVEVAALPASVRTSSVLARPGTPISRQWPRREDGDQHLVDHLLLADDHFGHLFDDGVASAHESGYRMLNIRWAGVGAGGCGNSGMSRREAQVRLSDGKRAAVVETHFHQEPAVALNGRRGTDGPQVPGAAEALQSGVLFQNAGIGQDDGTIGAGADERGRRLQCNHQAGVLSLFDGEVVRHRIRFLFSGSWHRR